LEADRDGALLRRGSWLLFGRRKRSPECIRHGRAHGFNTCDPTCRLGRWSARDSSGPAGDTRIGRRSSSAPGGSAPTGRRGWRTRAAPGTQRTAIGPAAAHAAHGNEQTRTRRAMLSTQGPGATPRTRSTVRPGATRCMHSTPRPGATRCMHSTPGPVGTAFMRNTGIPPTPPMPRRATLPPTPGML
jgi:hypothetical protein